MAVQKGAYMRGARLALSVIDTVLWIVVGYLIYQSAGLVFGRVVGDGMLPVIVVAVLSVAGSCLSIRSLGRNLAQSVSVANRGLAFGIWMSRLFLGVMLVSFLVWNCYALWAGLDVVFHGILPAFKIVAIGAFLVYALWLVANYRAIFMVCVRDRRMQEVADGS